MKSEVELKQMGYSDKAVAIILGNENLFVMNDANFTFKDSEECGDVLTLFLKINNDKIIDASFIFEGCLGLKLASTILTKMIKNLSLSNAGKIKFEDILEFAEKVPVNKQECIHFAISTLRKAIAEYEKQKLVS